MMKSNGTSMDILRQIQTGRVTVKQGAQLLRQLKQLNRGDTRTAVSETPGDRSVQIAIIGMSGRFPGANNPGEFWENLSTGVDSVREIPAQRWDKDAFFHPAPPVPNKTYCQHGGFLHGIDRFDPWFFNISPREAELMDPQQRLFLQEAWKALEDAGYSPHALANKKCGVFVGCSSGDYQDQFPGKNIHPHSYTFMGNAVSILSARISYFLDLKGPGVTIDTACSSSLTAIHLGCESIRQGTSEIALAGGVALQVTPKFHILGSSTQMLSFTGKCRTFDDAADGFVPGEGVGVVVLKPLPAARRDRDHIYAVIKGIGLNQDGKTNGITAPSATSQTALECEVYETYHIDPGTIGYIEAHGTATKLGDPIEVQALTDAFRKYTSKKQYCAIGSVKTNIGHTLAAAGAASIIKVLLSFKHKQIPPSLHYQTPNRHINFNDSPFYVNTRLSPWQSIDQQPRRAAVSSFGFSGTNAHIVLEEPPGETGRLAPLNARQTATGRPYFFIPLSAKATGSLEQKYKELSDWLAANPNADIGDIAYTLLRGRTHFTVRAALVVKNSKDLQSSLRDLVEKGQTSNFLKVNLETESADPIPATGPIASTEGIQFIDRLLSDPSLASDRYRDLLMELAAVYVRRQDQHLDWSMLYPDNGREYFHRLSLPGYPFETGRYWLPETGETAGERMTTTAQAPGCTPRECSSGTGELCFKKPFTGKEFYLEDHIHTLPAVVYLEMVRAAGDQVNRFSRARKFRQVVWSNPVIVNEKVVEVEIHLQKSRKKDWVEFQVITHPEAEPPGTGDQRLIHSRGMFRYDWCSPGAAGALAASAAPQPQTLDIEAVLNRCQGGKHEAEAFYRLLENNNSYLGPRFKSLQEFYFNENEALARVGIAAELEKDLHQYLLHPALTDSALQCMAAFGYRTGLRRDRVYVPYVLGEMEIVQPAENPVNLESRVCYAYVRKAAGSLGNYGKNSEIKTFDALLLDRSGRVRVRMKAFSFRPFTRITRTPQLQEEIIYYYGKWEKSPHQLPPQEPAARHPRDNSCLLVFDTHTGLMEVLKDKYPVVLVKPGKRYKRLKEHLYEVNPGSPGDYSQLLDALQQHIYPGKILHFWSKEAFSTQEHRLDLQLHQGLYSIFYLSQALLERKHQWKEPLPFYYFFSSSPGEVQPQYAAVNGFTRTAARESSALVYRSIALDSRTTPGSTEDSTALAGIISHEIQCPGETEVMYKGGIRYLKRLEEYQPVLETGEPYESREKPISLLKENGVYIITGGLGALGMIFARYLALQVKARLVLTDLKEINTTDRQKIEELEQFGAEVLFIKADICRRSEVEMLFKEVTSRYKGVNGILHAAGVTRDTFLHQKTREEIQTVLAPKVYGSVYLDEDSSSQPLDFFVMFSSLTALLGSPGQCDYGYANSFMDNYARYRTLLHEQGKCPGKTISINWPYWKNGGMRMDKRIENLLVNEKGIIPLEDETGLRAFETLLVQPHHQLGVVWGNREKIVHTLNLNLEFPGRKTGPHEPAVPTAQTPQSPLQTIVHTNAKKEFTGELLNTVSTLLKIPENRLTLQGNISNYGFDSISFTELAQELNNKYQLGVTPDVFFEHSTLGSIANYLLERYRDKIAPPGNLQGAHPVDRVGGSSPAVEEYGEYDGYEEEVELDGYTDGEQGVSDEEMLFSPARQEPGGEPIAIIGMSGVMPQSEDLEAFWASIMEGKDLVSEIPADRWDWRDFVDRTPVKWGAFMKDAGKFDSLFFNISPREAELMDPQLRIFLEVVWHTLEDAGYKVSQLEGSDTAVFVGVSTLDYKRVLDRFHKVGSEQLSFMVANRVSYFFDWHGPSEAVDTACSSSLVALHRAAEAVRSGTCPMAIAGGVSVIADPFLFINEAKSGMLSPNGRCYTFDKRANGYVRGEGVGAVLLKPLNKALADNDHIYGVIRGSAVNHSGHTNSPTTPNPAAQAEVIFSALEKAGLDPAAVSYIEAHGTATSLGDPIEINGIKKAFEQLYKKWNKPLPINKHCGIGTVKTNIGHLEASAGIAGIINVLLAMKHRTLIGNIHFQEMNPYINLDNSPFYIVKETMPWNPPGDEKGYPLPRCAGVSSFGIGGANAHVVLEEWPGRREQGKNHNRRPAANCTEAASEPAPGKNRLILLSARNEERLKVYAQKLAGYMENTGEECTAPILEDIAYTLQVGREPMEERLAIIISTAKELEAKLHQYCREKRESAIENLYTGNIKKQKSGILPEDEEGETFIRMIIQKGKLEKAAQLWISGVDIDWSLLYPGKTPRRISLPTYPFTNKRHWVTRSTGPAAPFAAPVSPVTVVHRPRGQETDENMENELRRFLYIPVWKPGKKDKQTVTTGDKSTKKDKKVVLVVYPPPGSGFKMPGTFETFISSLHEKNKVKEIRWGTRTGKQGKQGWQVEPGDSSAWEKVIGQLKLKHLHTIYFLAGMAGIQEESHDEKDTLEKMSRDWQYGVLALFRLIKALNRHDLSRYPLQIKIITNDVCQVHPGDLTVPCHAALHGLAGVLSREYPHFAVQSIDTRAGKELLDAIALGFPGRGYEELALREGRCFVRKIEPLVLPGPHPKPFKINGVYWIIGGAGKIGLELSHYLAGSFKARLVLSGRSELNQDLEKKIAAIESAGGKVLYLQADAADLAGMKKAVQKIKAAFGTINGVIHAAAAVKNKALENMEEQMFEAGLASKVKGSMVLHQVLQGEPLDFLVFFSSVQSFIAEPGMSNYVAANAFQDAFAHYLDRRENYPVKTVNWGYWGIQSSIVNQAASRSVVQHGLNPFDPSLGIEALVRILGSEPVQVIPLKAEPRLLQELGLTGELPDEQPRLDKQTWLKLEESHNRLEEFSRYVLLDIFRKMGVFCAPGEFYDRDTLRNQLKIIPDYYRLFDVLLEILEKGVFIRCSHTENKPPEIVSTTALAEPRLQEKLNRLPEEKEQILASYPDIEASVHLLWICYEKYPDILRGNIPAAEVLFPNSSMELMERLYKGNVEADYYNRLVVFAFESYMQMQHPLIKEGKRVKVLEIGAGTGGTSAPLFEAIHLNGYTGKVHYIYTDISHAFARYGKEQYGTRNPFVEFKVLDIEKDVKKQGYAPGDFDVIVAANVLHATRLMKNTLTNVQLLLKSGGRLILNEGTKNRDYGSIMFGLLEGWWLYQDEENRLPGCPMLTIGTWERILQEQGFREVTIIGQPGVGSMTGMQHIITARLNKGDENETGTVKPEPTAEAPQQVNINIDTAPVQLDRCVEETIIRILAAVLQMEIGEFNPDAPYTDFGVDSILAIEIVNKVNETLGIHLRSTDLFNYTSIKKLTAYILEEFGDIINFQGPGVPLAENPGETTAPATISPPPTPPLISQQQEQEVGAGAGTWVDIAVIGISGRFPDARDVEELWENLAAGRNSVREITRWETRTYYDPDPSVPDKSYCKWGGLLSDIDAFDPLFFNISPKEAELMDPQQRLFLEQAWKALEDAGYSDRDLEEKKCGVFVGFNASDYRKVIEESGLLPDAYMMTGNYEAMLSARISYFLNLRGPAITVNTACSASLTAVHLACESICCGTSEIAIAGGVGIMNSPALYILLSRTEVLSFTGQCRAFDNAADGIALGEGVGTVVLKRLDQALEDGDHIYGVIIGAGLNQDGRSNGITAPNGPAQTALECEIYDKYHIDPGTITYVEAHGTGTRLGDPMEIEALTDAFRKYTSKKQYCAVGSIKSNIGHLGAAAGVTGLIKVLLCMKYKKLVPSLFVEKPNSLIDFGNSPFYLNTTLRDWETHEMPRIAAVSSFGFSGTNAHLIIREVQKGTGGLTPLSIAPSPVEQPGKTSPYYLIPISAKTSTALNQKLTDMIHWLEHKGNQHCIKDISYTLLKGRSHFSLRSCLLVKNSCDTANLAKKLRLLLAGKEIEDYLSNTHIPADQRSKPKLEPALRQLGEKVIREFPTPELTADEYKKKLQVLADLYIKGYSLDWQEIYRGRKCRRLSMPTYPFAREKYGISHQAALTEQQDLEIKEIMQKLENGEITLSEANCFMEEII